MENNKLKRAWIWFWYNTATRFCLVLFPSYFVVAVPLLLYLGVTGEPLRNSLMALYWGMFGWALVDNDYENLNRIGLTVDRRPMSESQIAAFLARRRTA